MTEAPEAAVIRQHLIDPEICIRCNTCESTCPVGAITHDARNYVVDASICNLCMACVPPCPTGSIDNWRAMPRAQAYSTEAQLGWDALPAELSAEDLGGGDMHTRVSGVADTLARDDRHALGLARRAVANLNRAPKRSIDWAKPVEPFYPAEELELVAPVDLRQQVDAREIIARIVDGSEFDEFKPRYGATLVTGFARLSGMLIGVIASNGVLFSDSALKGTHFVELCVQRGVPMLFLQNISGFMVGQRY